MSHSSFAARAPRWIGALIGLSVLLTACTIEGGVAPATPAAPTPGAAPTSAAAAAALAAREDTWAIGLVDVPDDLYPYPPDAAAERAAAPILELLYPSPILAYNYGYTTTGVLEQIPTLENGGAEIRKTTVYLDAAGNITTTVTDLITQVDQLVVTFRWNPRLRWSDGTPLTAADSVFAYELAKAAPPNDQARDRLAQIVSYEQVDEHTTRAILQPDLVGSTYFMTYWTPLPRHVLKGIAPDQVRSSPFARAPIGYGPYAIAERSPGAIRMVRNPYYFGSPPAATHLTIAFLSSVDMLRAGVLNGSLDAAATDRTPIDQFAFLEQDKAAGLARVIYLPSPIWTHIDFNLDVPLLQDIRLRRAIAYGTNRQAMVDALFDGRAPVLESWILPGQPEAAPLDQITRYPYNPDEARRLLDEAGYADTDGDGIRASPDGVTLTLQLVTTKNMLFQETARRFQQDMRAIGIAIDLQFLPAEQLFDPGGPLFQRQFELALFAWIAGPDPGGLALWSCNAVPSPENGWSGDNFAGWCFRDANQAILAAVTSLDPAARKAAYLRHQQLWTQEVPVLPLYQRLSLAIIAPDVRGPQPDPLAPLTWNIAAWRRER